MHYRCLSKMQLYLRCPSGEKEKGKDEGEKEMISVSPVMQGSEDIEVVLGKNQPQYRPLPAVYLDTVSCAMVTRWRLSEEEREAISRGADVVLQQLTFRNPFQPVNMQIVMPDQDPVLVEEVL